MVERLLPTLNVAEKNLLTGPRRSSRSPVDRPHFRPSINQRSERIAEKKRSFRDEEFRDFMVNEGKKWEENRAICHEMVKKLEENQPFKPKTKAYRPPKGVNADMKLRDTLKFSRGL